MNIIIIGAGAAGLMAAKELSANHQVKVLEARDTIGGRIRTLRPGIETGAEFVHGKLPVTLGLLEKAGLSYTPIEGKMYSVDKGEWSEEENFIEGWDELLENMGALTQDMTLLEFLETYYAESKYSALREEVTRYVQGFDLANPAKVSVKYLSNEWNNEDFDNFRVDAGYHALMEYLAGGINVETAAVVKEINWGAGVTVTTADGQNYHGDKVIITVPLGVLQHGGLKFTPAIDDYMNAASHIGFGSVIKIVLVFKERCWKPDTGFIFGKAKVPTWWTQSPNEEAILTGWLGGPPAEEFKQVSEEVILKTALDTLSEFFQRELPELVSYHILNWVDDPETLGSYSYDTPKTDEARKLLNTPIEQTIFFAGEALYDGNHPGTVEAALITGIDVAKKI